MSTSTALAKTRKTPGVYITEFPAFPPSIVGVATAVPVFIGYTETAADPATGKQMYNQVVALSSMVDFIDYFGQGYVTVGAVAKEDTGPYDFQAQSMKVTDDTRLKLETARYAVVSSASGDQEQALPKFNLYSAMQLFFANGGGNCYVISVANYAGDTSLVKADRSSAQVVKGALLESGIKVAEAVKGATMLVVPDACLLDTTDYTLIVCAMLNQAKKQQDRVAIIDLPGAQDSLAWTPAALKKQAETFYATIATADTGAFSYGAAYAPALESSLLSIDDIDYTKLYGASGSGSTALLNNLLTTQALAAYGSVVNSSEGKDELVHSDKFQAVAASIAAAFPLDDAGMQPIGSPAGITGFVPQTAEKSTSLLISLQRKDRPSPTAQADIDALDQYLTNAVPLIGQIEQILANQLNVVPPSGIMAGIWSQNDANRGVWNAPANLSLSRVIAPKVILDDDHQGDLNVPLNGNSIGILRATANRGTVVWGARTLDGNSLDYRYIQVRRTLNYIEQSIKGALQQFVFAANDGGTWATVTAAIASFLTQLWQAGGLMGDKASDAFTVNCGVPTTMSGLDVLNGYMIVSVTVQLIHPAEFIELTFKQTMQGA